MENIFELKEILRKSEVQNVLILPHNMPDGDTIGSAIGIKVLVEYFNKRGYIVLNDGIPSNLSFLIDETVSIYTSDEIKDVIFELVISVDCGETKLFEDRKPLFDLAKYSVNIDHHKTNSNYAKVNIVDCEASSTGELIFLLFEKLNCPLNSKSAQALYAAIVTDTGSFRYSNTRSITFNICQKLFEVGFDFNQLNVEIFQNKSYEKLLLLNKVFDTLKLYRDGRCAVIKLSKELIDNLNLTEYDTDGIVEFVRDIKGVEVVVFIRSLGDMAHKVSMRSKYDFDVSEIALKFKGGGHKKAAGFKMDNTMDEIEMLVVKAIEEAI